MVLKETSFPIHDEVGEEGVEFAIDFDVETYLSNRKKVLYSAADIASAPQYSKPFLDLKAGKALLSDFSEETRITFKDKEGNCSLVKADPAMIETLCPTTYTRYQKSVDTDRGGRPGSYVQSSETRHIRAELLDELKVKLAELGFDFSAEEDSAKAFDGANHAWQEAYRKRYEARHLAKRSFELTPVFAKHAKVLYSAADIASAPQYSQDFLDLQPGKAILSDFGGEVRITFKDSEGNFSLLEVNEVLIETLCPKTYARYKQSSTVDRGEKQGSYAQSPETQSIRAALLDEFKVALTELGFDFQGEADIVPVFEGANHAWQEASKERYDARLRAQKDIDL